MRVPLDKFAAANRDNWSDRVPIHWDSEEYGVQKFINEPDRLSEVVKFDLEHGALPDVAGKSLVHLQCHIGHDTLSWARTGAEVTGVDFSDQAIAAARILSEQSGTPGEFVVSDVYDSPAALGHCKFDIVYTGVGAICWLPDISRWAQVVAELLKPGGQFYIIEGHPMMWSVSDEDHGEQIVLEWPYFESAGAQGYVDGGTNAGDGEVEHTQQYNFTHGLGEIINALIQAGLVIDEVREYQTLHWQAFPMLVPAKNGRWKMPDGKEDYLPLMQSIKAHKPD